MNIWGLCGRAKKLPCCTRLGTKVIAGALGGALRQDGGFDLDEFLARKIVPHRLADPVAEKKVLLERSAPKVEVAVLQAERLARIRILFDLEGRGFRLAEHLERGDADLDLPRLQVRVGHPLGPEDHLPPDGQHPFRADLPGELVGRLAVGGIGHHLGDAVAIAQVDENEPAVIPACLGPAHQHHLAVHVPGPEIAARVGASGGEKRAQIFSSRTGIA